MQSSSLAMDARAIPHAARQRQCRKEAFDGAWDPRSSSRATSEGGPVRRPFGDAGYRRGAGGGHLDAAGLADRHCRFGDRRGRRLGRFGGCIATVQEVPCGFGRKDQRPASHRGFCRGGDVRAPGRRGDAFRSRWARRERNRVANGRGNQPLRHGCRPCENSGFTRCPPAIDYAEPRRHRPAGRRDSHSSEDDAQAQEATAAARGGGRRRVGLGRRSGFGVSRECGYRWTGHRRQSFAFAVDCRAKPVFGCWAGIQLLRRRFGCAKR